MCTCRVLDQLVAAAAVHRLRPHLQSQLPYAGAAVAADAATAATAVAMGIDLAIAMATLMATRLVTIATMNLIVNLTVFKVTGHQVIFVVCMAICMSAARSSQHMQKITGAAATKLASACLEQSSRSVNFASTCAVTSLGIVSN